MVKTNNLKIVSALILMLSVLTFDLSAEKVGEKDKTTKSTSKVEFTWKRTPMNGSRTGCKAATVDNVTEALGRFEGKKYIAPNGRVFSKGITPKIAKLLLAAQPKMAEVKEVIAYAPKAMIRKYPESEITNWFVDFIMDIVQEKSGKHVDLGILNFGGVRIDMPQGDVTLDDIMSMFPFKNNICYVALKGKDVRVILEDMAATTFQILGGVKCVARDGKLVSATINGEPLNDEKVYGVATISFLLNGGDGISVAKNAVELKIFDDYVLDVVLPYVRGLGEKNIPIEYQVDGRVNILN